MSLFNLVNSIVNSQNENEANKLLIGSNILLLNNREYYNAIISNFIQKKETIIKKENGKLIFDLNNTNDIWNIIFISEYIKENDILYKIYNNLLLVIADIESQLSIIKNKHKNAKSKEEHASINTEYQKLNNILQSKKNQRESMSGVLATFYNTDWVNLINSNDKIEQLPEINILKKAINIIHKIRNSLEHDNLDIDKVIELDNDNFKISIPIEYLDGFNKGRIIANHKDEIIVERTNAITLPLLKELNCDINEIQSFFYNLAPEFLSYLLDTFDNDINKLYDFSTSFFRMSSSTSKIIEQFKENEIDLKILKFMPIEELFWWNPFDFSSSIEVLKWLKRKGELNNISNIPYSFLFNYERSIRLLEKIKNQYGSLDILKTIEGYSIQIYEESEILNLLEKINMYKQNGFVFPNKSISPKEFSNLEKSIKISTEYFNSKKIDEHFISYPNESLNILGFFKDNNIDLKNFFNLPILSFIDVESLKDIFKLFKENNVDYIYIPKIYFILDNEGTSKCTSVIKVLKVLQENGINISTLIKNTNSLRFVEHIDTTINILNQLCNEGYSINDIPPNAYVNLEAYYELLEYKNFINLGKLPKDAFYKIEETKKIIKYIEENNICNEILYNSHIYYYFELLFIKIITMCKNNNIKNIHKLPEFMYYTEVKEENFEKILEFCNYEETKLKEFPNEFYTCDIEILDEMISKYNYNLCKSIFGIGNSKLISALIYGNSVFSQYQKEKHDDLLIDIDPITIIHAGFNTSLMYKSNISEWNQETYLTRFISNESEQLRDNTEIKKYILDKFRNACAHFRFKPVLDNQGNIVEDKIYIYDKYDESNETNFDIILDIRDFVEITRQVEKGLLQKKDEEFIIDEENRFKKR